MNVIETTFIIIFFGAFTILGTKLYNILKLHDFYDWQFNLLGFFGYLMTWFICFVIFMSNKTLLLYRVSFLTISFFMVVCFIFSVIELMLWLKKVSEKDMMPSMR